MYQKRSVTNNNRRLGVAIFDGTTISSASQKEAKPHRLGGNSIIRHCISNSIYTTESNESLEQEAFTMIIEQRKSWGNQLAATKKFGQESHHQTLFAHVFDMLEEYRILDLKPDQNMFYPQTRQLTSVEIFSSSFLF